MTKDGHQGFRPIVYNIRRSRNGIVALWGRWIKASRPSRPLSKEGLHSDSCVLGRGIEWTDMALY